MRFAPLLCLFSACASGAYSPRLANRESEGMTSQTPGGDVHIHIEIPGGTFAAYQLVIHWDPNIAHIREIVSCNARKFPGNPEFDPGTFATGKTKVFATAVRAKGYGDYHLVTVKFDRVAAGTTRVDVVVEALYDDSVVPRRITGILTIQPRELHFD